MSYLSGIHPLELIIRALFVSVGGLLTCFFLWQAGNNLFIMTTYQHARAEVIECERIGPLATKGLNSYSVQVRFDRPAGSRTASVERPHTWYEVGEVIDIYFLPETSYKVVAGNFMQMWFHVFLIGGVSLIFLFFGLKPSRP